MRAAWVALALVPALAGCSPELIGGVAGAVVGEVVTATLRGGSTALPAPQGSNQPWGLPGGAGGGSGSCGSGGCPNAGPSLGTGLPGGTGGGCGGGGCPNSAPPTGLPGGIPLPLPSIGLPTLPGLGGAGAYGEMEQEAWRLTNAFRSRLGLSALAWDDQMAAVARAHSADMGKRAYFDHTNPDGQSPFDRMRSAGVSFGAAAENIYMTSGAGSAAGAIDAWDKSPGHHANMAGLGFKRIGIGISKEGGRGTHFTQVFAD